MINMKKYKVFIFVPTEGGMNVNSHLLKRLFYAHSETSKAKLDLDTFSGSLLPRNFNQGWCRALQEKAKNKMTHFLMIHADIAPVTEGWIDTLLTIMEVNNADVVSVVSPIKDDRGLTSTARDTHVFFPQRYTTKEIGCLPRSFDAELVNTGIMLVDFRKEWVTKINPPFALTDRIFYDYDNNNYPFPACVPEDWNFSREVRKLGCMLVATTEVEIIHYGLKGYSNQDKWGKEYDMQNARKVGIRKGI